MRFLVAIGGRQHRKGHPVGIVGIFRIAGICNFAALLPDAALPGIVGGLKISVFLGNAGKVTVDEALGIVLPQQSHMVKISLGCHGADHFAGVRRRLLEAQHLPGKANIGMVKGGCKSVVQIRVDQQGHGRIVGIMEGPEYLCHFINGGRDLQAQCIQPVTSNEHTLGLNADVAGGDLADCSVAVDNSIRKICTVHNQCIVIRRIFLQQRSQVDDHIICNGLHGVVVIGADALTKNIRVVLRDNDEIQPLSISCLCNHLKVNFHAGALGQLGINVLIGKIAVSQSRRCMVPQTLHHGKPVILAGNRVRNGHLRHSRFCFGGLRRNFGRFRFRRRDFHCRRFWCGGRRFRCFFL